MKINKTFAVSIITLATVALLATPAIAQTGSGNASSTMRYRGMRNGLASTTNPQQRMANLQAHDSVMLDNRIASLNKLADRLQAMVKLSDTQKASLTTEIQTEIVLLTDLKAKLPSDTSTTTLRADIQSITKAYRIFALIEPQINIIAAADREQSIVSMMQTIGSKIQIRLSASTTALTDFNAKLTDANTQAEAAIALVVPLKPDNGDQTVFQANETALKSARMKVQAAQKDIVATRKIAQGIISDLVKKQ